jgi:hypothetical protein
MSNVYAQTISLDDEEFSNPVEYDPSQDQDIRIPPPELDSNGNAIDYLFKLSVADNKNGQKQPTPRQTQRGTKYLMLNVNCQIVQPGGQFDKAFVQLMPPSTMTFNGTTSAANLARILGELMPKNLSHKDQMEFLMGLLASEPTLGGRVQWTGYCRACEKDIPALQGEKNWPEKKDEAGNVIGHEPVAICPDCHGEVTANVKVDKLIPGA